MQSLMFRDVVPFILLFVLLIGGAILADWALHVLGLVWIGRYFGIVGTLLILASFVIPCASIITFAAVRPKHYCCGMNT